MIKLRSDGFVLITALWVLGFLTVLAVGLGFGARQKIVLLKHVEDRSRTRLAAEAGAKKAIAVLLDDVENEQLSLSADSKMRRMNNPAEFLNISVGDCQVDVAAFVYDEKQHRVLQRPGLSDEQGKINLNTVDRDTLARLLEDVLSRPAAAARTLADALIDWRDVGRHELTGFASDDYYKNLPFPYEVKEEPYERLDEMLLIRGMDAAAYEMVRPFVTVYGDGRININTAARPVLEALGLEPVVVDKILKARFGADGVDGTQDDHVFRRAFDVAAEVNAFVKLEEKWARQIDALNARNLLGTTSSVYSFQSRAVSTWDSGLTASVDVVFNVIASRVEYWNEK